MVSAPKEAVVVAVAHTRIKDLLRKLQFLRKGEQLLWEPIDQRNGDRVAQSVLGTT